MILQNASIAGFPLSRHATVDSNKENSSAHKRIDISKAFWIFLIGSLVGFIVETIWCLLKNGTIESRSCLMFAPINAIYGIGALVLYTVGQCMTRKNILNIFIVGVIAGTVVEYLCSLFQETLFGSVSWDYSGVFLNIGGRVCLLYSVFWGLLAVLWFIAIQPIFEKLINKIPSRMYRPITLGILMFLVLVTVISIAAVARWGMRIDGLPAQNTLATMIDHLFPDKFMEHIYPNMVYVS